MEKKLQRNTEKGLKAWLKKKGVGVTAALLTAFLITGDLSAAGSASSSYPDALTENLMERIAFMKAEIEDLLWVNEIRLAEAERKAWDLLLAGDYYANPVYPSAQIFFDVSYDRGGRMKNRTSDAWSVDIGLAGEYLAALELPEMSWYDACREYYYNAGLVTGRETGREVLVDGNGTIAVGGAHATTVDFGINIKLAKPQIDVREKAIAVSLTKPVIPPINILITTPNMATAYVPATNAPTAGTVSHPLVTLDVRAPQAVTQVTVDSTTPAVPAGIHVTAPQVNVNVTPPSIAPTLVTTPDEPDEPQSLSFNVAPARPGVFTPPTTPANIQNPAAPTAPGIAFTTPSELVYEVGGMSQISTVQMNYRNQGIAMMNYQNYDTDGGTFEFNMTYVRGGLTPVSGTMRANPDGVSPWEIWTPSALTYMPNAFITDARDHNVDIDGDYLMHVAGSTWYPIFINYSPYLVGSESAADKTLDFKGTLTITGSGGAAMGHQLLAGGVYGTTGYPNVTGGVTTSIMKNSGTINLSGTELVGIFTNTAYDSTSSPTTYFHKRPQTINSGTINITAGSTACIAVDYDFYRVQNATDTAGPNNDLYLGNINIDGTNNIGYRQKNFGSQYGSYFNFFDLTRVYGSNGVMRIDGSQNTGIYIGMGVSTGNPVSNLNGLQILVGGSQNTGIFIRETRNTNPAVLGSSSLGTNFGFAAGATQSVLMHTAWGELILDKDLTLTTGGTKNALMASSSATTAAATINAGRTVTSSLTEFYGLVALASSGSTVNHHGTIRFSGANSIGIAVNSTSSTGNSDGDIFMTGSDAIGIYSLGYLHVSGGEINVAGVADTGIFHNSSRAGTISNADIISDGAKSIGIYNNGSGLLAVSGGTITAKGATGATNLGVGIYNAASRTINPNGVAFNARDYAAAIYNLGSTTVTGGSMAATGQNAIGVYQVGGAATIGTNVAASGNQAVGVVFKGGSLSFTGGNGITASGAQSVGVYNVATLSGTPGVTLSGDRSIGIYNEASATLGASGTISSSGSGLTRLAGIYNAGNLASSSAIINVSGESSSGVYNVGSVGTLGGTITVSGTAAGISAGIHNTAGKTVTNVTGTINTGTYATAVYNAGTMTITGAVNATATGQYTGIYNTGAGTLSMPGNIQIAVTGTNAAGIYNDSTGNISLTGGAITISGASSAGLYHAGTGVFTLGGSASAATTGAGSAGVVNDGGAGGGFVMSGGTVTATGAGTTGSAGIYNQSTAADFTMSGGTVTAYNQKSAGVFNNGTFKMSGGAVKSDGASTTGFYNHGPASVLEILSGNSGTLGAKGDDSSALYNDEGTVNIRGNAAFNAEDGAIGLYTVGGIITAYSGAVLSVNVNNTLVAPATGAGEGVGVFAVNTSGGTGAQVNLQGAKITVVNGATAVASYGAGPGPGVTTIDLTGGTVDYSGAGYAVYSNGDYGIINLTGAQLNLRGAATGISVDFAAGTPSIIFSGTRIDMYSSGSTLADFVNFPTTLYASSLVSGISAALGSVIVTDHSGGTCNLARVDGGVIHLDADVSRSATSGPGADYYRRFHGQRMKLTLDAGHTATAVLNTAGAALFNNQVIGLEGNSSVNALLPADTEIIIEAGAKVTAARTDTTTDGAVGVYMNYGKVKNDGAIEVQQGYTGVKNGVGIFAVNGSVVENAGSIKVAGDKASGIVMKSYRLQGGVNNVGAEFGPAAADQGKITVTNTGTIQLTGKASVGIYAENNSGAGTLPAGTPAWGVSDNIVANTGTITVGSGNSIADPAVGLYGSGVTLKNSGTVTAGDYAVGIYGQNGTIITDVTGGNLGTVKIGGNSVAILGTGATISSSVTSLTLQSDNTTADKIGIMYAGTPADVHFNIDGQAFKKGTIVYLENPGTSFEFGSGTTMKVGASGVGIYLSESVTPGISVAVNKGSIELSAGSANAVALYTDGGIIENNGTIDLRGTSGQVALFARGSNGQLDNTGTVNLLGNDGTALYLEDGATLLNMGAVNYGTSTQSTVILLKGANANIGGLSITTPNISENILVYAEDHNGTGSVVTNGGTLTVNGGTPVSGNQKTIGVYLHRNTTQNIYNGGTVLVQQGALGIYSRGDNRIGNVAIDVDGKNGVGVYIDGASTLANISVAARGAVAGESVIGVYGRGGVITVTTGLSLQTGTTAGSDYGAGMFLTGGASVAGADITVNNRSTAVNVGLYYQGASGSVVHGSNLILSGNDLVGIYADGGLTVTNAKSITSTSMTAKRIGAYTTGGATYISTSAGNIIATPGSAGILAGSGNGVNRGTLIVANAGSTAMAALAVLSGETAAILNDAGATINVNAGAGMVIGYKTGYAGTSVGVNKGTIQVAAGAAGVALSGTHAGFDGTGGVIQVNGSSSAAIYLEETSGSPITNTGTILLNAPDAMGIYALSAEIPFDVTLGAGVSQGVGIYAMGTAAKPTTIKGVVDTSASTGTIAVFVSDANVRFANATVKTGKIGLYINNMSNWTLSGVTVEANHTGATGIYTTAGNLNYAAITKASGGGLGIYVPAGTAITTTGGTVSAADVSSVGIFLDGGTGNIGTVGALNLQLAGGVGIIAKNGATLNIGSQFFVSGPGTAISAENANIYNYSEFSVSGAPALLGSYTTTGPWTLENTVNGVIHATGGGTGIAALKTGGSPQVTIINRGLIDVSGMNAANQSSVGIYTDVAEIQNPGKIEVGRDAIGIYANNTGKAVTSHEILMPGQDTIGIIVSGPTAGITSDKITALTHKGMGMHLNQVTGTVAAGIIDLSDSSVGLYIKGGAPVLTSGSIKTGNVGLIAPIGIYAASGANVSMTTPLDVTVGRGGFAIAADASNISGVDPAKLQAGVDGVVLAATNGGSIATIGAGTLTVNENIGVYLNNGSSVTGLGAIDVSQGGLGAWVEAPTATLPTITVKNGIPATPGTSARYSMGVYYSGVGITASAPVIQQIGSWSIGAGFDNGITATLGNITLGAAGATHQIGAYAMGSAVAPDTLITGNIAISGADNIGIYGSYTDVTAGDVATADLSGGNGRDHESVGLYLQWGGANVGDIKAGNSTTGLYAGNLSPTGIGASSVAAGDNALGIYASGSGSETVSVTGDVSVGSHNAAGIYGIDVNIAVGGDLSAGAGAAVGIASIGRGNVSLGGAALVDSGTSGNGGVALYKRGPAGSILTGAAGWTIGDYGYGIYAEQENAATGDQLNIVNKADMSLGEAAVGIYANGTQLSVENYGILSAGTTYLGPAGSHLNTASHENSAALYLAGGAAGVNYGTIKTEQEHSVGVYVTGTGTRFENSFGGNIVADNGATGILVQGDFGENTGIEAVNNGNILVGGSAGICDVINIGMAAYGGATVINGASGVIDVWNGAGMYAGNDGVMINNGVINVYTYLGSAVGGTGTLINNGQMNLVTGSGKTDGRESPGGITEGSVTITNKGIYINDKYITVGGVIQADAPMVLSGATVSMSALQSITSPLFTAPDITGTIRLTPDFVKIGNGWAFIVEGFDKAFAASGISKLTVETSPMYLAREAEGKLYVAKRPYVEVMLPGVEPLSGKAQDTQLYEGLDSLLYGDPDGTTKDALILKDMNAYLEEFYAKSGSEGYLDEITRTVSETRGDIYATIQKRMQHVESAFERSFEELIDSRNITKDSDKYSVIARQGRFRDDTTGIDNYDYHTYGLLYMKEHEGRDYGNKWGWSLGFAVSRFDFDDGPKYQETSKEDIYSVRVGWHRVKALKDDNRLRWITKLEGGYNYHQATRVLELDKTIKNKGHYESMQISWDNTIEKTLSRNLKGCVDLFAGLKTEYGIFGGFREKGEGLELAVSHGDYLSVKPEIGIKGQGRVYMGKKISLNITGSLSADLELGDNFDSNRARIKNGSAGKFALVHPEKERGSIGAGFGVSIGHTNKWDVALDISARKRSNRESLDVSGGIRFKYVFEPWGTSKLRKEN